MKPSLVVLLLAALVAAQARAQETASDEPLAPAPAGDAGLAIDPESSPDPRGFSSVVRSTRPLSRDQTQDETRVRGERLRESTRASTLEALSQESADVYVPGRGALHGVSNGATGGVRIRGLGGSPNSQIVVVEDGVPDYQGIFGHPIPDAYVPFLLEDALVVKGGDSVLFGTNAMGGVIVLRSRWRESEGVEVESDAAMGSFATVRGSATVLAKIGAGDVAAAVHALSTDGHREGAGGTQQIGSVAGRYRLMRDVQLTVRNKLVHLSGADPGPATHPTPDHWYDVWRDAASLQLCWRPAPLARLTLTPHLNVGLHRLYDGFRSLDYVGGAHAELELKPHAAVDLLLGLSADHVGGEVEDRIAGEQRDVRGLTDLAFYNQLTARPFPWLTAVLGTRELYSTTWGFVFLFKGGLSVEPVEGLTLRTRVARNFRQPTLRELYLPFPTANPDLRPETSLNWDFGASFKAGRFSVSASGYRTEARDLIRYFGSWPSAEVVNVGHVTVWGVEGSASVERLGPFALSVTANWQDVGTFTRQNPSAKANFAVDFAQEWGSHALGATASGEYVHGLYMGDYGRKPIPDVFVLDLALRYRFTAAERDLTLEPYLMLRNLLDRKYAYVESYPMPGFNALLGLKLGI